MAAGVAIAGFGGGTIIFAPVIKSLLDLFREAPAFIGPKDSVDVVIEGGQRMVELDGLLTPVVMVSSIVSLHLSNLSRAKK